MRIGQGSGISAGMKNPFPGMNPWLEAYWRDVHASLLVYARDLLNAELPPGRVYHHACVTRPPWLTRHEFYVLPLRQCLPAIRVPLRRTDPDAALDLQVLVDQCFERGRYDSAVDYTQPPQPPLPEEEAAWAGETLSANGA